MANPQLFAGGSEKYDILPRLNGPRGLEPIRFSKGLFASIHYKIEILQNLRSRFHVPALS